MRRLYFLVSDGVYNVYVPLPCDLQTFPALSPSLCLSHFVSTHFCLLSTLKPSLHSWVPPLPSPVIFPTEIPITGLWRSLSSTFPWILLLPVGKLCSGCRNLLCSPCSELIVSQFCLFSLSAHLFVDFIPGSCLFLELSLHLHLWGFRFLSVNPLYFFLYIELSTMFSYPSPDTTLVAILLRSHDALSYLFLVSGTCHWSLGSGPSFIYHHFVLSTLVMFFCTFNLDICCLFLVGTLTFAHDDVITCGWR